MGQVIATAGKGGTGKTTIASLVVDYLVRSKQGSVLALDADPNANLHQALGIELKETVVGILDKTAALAGALPAGMTKDRYIEYEIQNALSEGAGFDLLAMGQPEGPGCYCYANNVLRGVIEKLSRSYDFTVIDNEAGMEHLSRRTARKIDSFIVVSDFSVVGVRSAARIYRLAGEMDLKIGKACLVLNMAAGAPDGLLSQALAETGLEVGATIPFDSEIERLSIAGEPVTVADVSSAARKALEELGCRLK
ncbi:MAG: AAA family ATPase [Candidatus Omnitrophota bacterium]